MSISYGVWVIKDRETGRLGYQPTVALQGITNAGTLKEVYEIPSIKSGSDRLVLGE